MLLALGVYAAKAVPAYRGALIAVDADGKEITIYKHGDESFHYQTDENGDWLSLSAEGKYEKTNALTKAQIMRRRNKSRRIAQVQRHAVERVMPPRVLVVLAQYSNVTFKSDNNLNAFDDMFNGSNYTFNGATGSVSKYFSDQSYGQYKPQFDVVGPVTLPQNQRFYGENDEFGDDRNAELMVAHACRLADEQYNVDFTQYDSDGDGYVDAVYVIYAGKGEADSNQEDAIWPHNARVEDSWDVECVVDGKRVNVYVCSSEIDDNGYREGIGTICHEFSHVMGLPDMYATDDDQGQKTLGEWDLMDYGGYNNQGRTPPSYSAYERFFMGWTEPILMNEPLNMVLRDLNISGDCGMITQSGQSNLNGLSPDPREFYLVENRQQSGWDKYLPGHGMLMTKVEFLKNKWEQNIVNCVPRNMCIDIIEADGKAPKYNADNAKNGYFGKQGDTYPSGATGWKGFSDKWYIDGITENNGNIYFDFQGGVAKSTVTFYTGANGTCATESATESSKRSGVILPTVSAKTGYTFLGWASRKSSTTADAGQAGDRFYPISDCTLYALYRNDKRVDINYSLKGVEWNSGATYYANRNEAFEITFAAKQGYYTPTAKTCQVRITRGNEAMNNYSFDGNLIIVRFDAKDVTDNIFITINNTRQQGENGCEEYRHTFTSTCWDGNNQDLSGYDWNISVRNTNTLNYDKSKGAIFGSSNYPAESVSLYTEETMGCGVAEIAVTASTGSGGDAELDVYLAGSPLGTTRYLDTEQQTYTFKPQQPLSGAVEIRLTNTAKAIYLKQIEIRFAKLDDPIDALNNQDFDQTQIVGRDGSLIINNLPDNSNICIYTMQGHQVISNNTNNTFIVPLPAGIYIVRINNTNYKTIIR